VPGEHFFCSSLGLNDEQNMYLKGYFHGKVRNTFHTYQAQISTQHLKLAAG